MTAPDDITPDDITPDDTAPEPAAAGGGELPLPATLSPSKISTFTSCGLQFRFSAIDRLPEPSSPAAARGTLVHLALQHLHRRPGPERTPANAAADLAAAYEEFLADPEIADLPEAREPAFFEEAGALVQRYFSMEDPTAVTSVGLEVMLEAEVGGLRLRGIIDRLDRLPDGSLVVVDYKSGSAPPPGFERGRLAGVQFYALLLEQVLGVLPIDVRLLYLGDGQTVSIAPSDRSVRGVAQKAAAIWKTVERAHATDGFKPQRSALCQWCSFRQYCPEFGGDPAEARRVALDLAAERAG